MAKLLYGEASLPEFNVIVQPTKAAAAAKARSAAGAF